MHTRTHARTHKCKETIVRLRESSTRNTNGGKKGGGREGGGGGGGVNNANKQKCDYTDV